MNARRLLVEQLEPGMRVKVGQRRPRQVRTVTKVTPLTYPSSLNGAARVYAVEVTFEGADWPSLFMPQARLTVAE